MCDYCVVEDSKKYFQLRRQDGQDQTVTSLLFKMFLSKFERKASEMNSTIMISPLD